MEIIRSTKQSNYVISTRIHSHKSDWNHSPLLQGLPQKYGQKANIWNIFAQHTQQFLCTSNASLKGPEQRKKCWNKETDNNTHALVRLSKGKNKKLKHENRIKNKRKPTPCTPFTPLYINQLPDPFIPPYVNTFQFNKGPDSPANKTFLTECSRMF